MSDVPQTLSLFELNNLVKTGIRELFPDAYWIIAEISEMNINQSGHCYLELVEKKTDSEQIITRTRATIWAFTFRMLRPYFESVTRQVFASGIKVMVQVSIEYHELYGFSLNVKDIEPNFTLGDLSRKRQEIIQRLNDEGVFHLNKELSLPVVPQRIAVISSDTAAGYGDFTDQLLNNQYGYSFQIKLFRAFMQGDVAEPSIIEALENIFRQSKKFDLVVIIRGGGSQADLNCFNSYWLCYHITQFPLPILTGIGHERDETIADLVAHTSLKTPTAVAEFIITQTAQFEQYLNELQNQTMTIASEQLQIWKDDTARLSRNINSLVKLRISAENQRILTYGVLMRNSLKGDFQKNLQQINTIKVRCKSYLRHVFQRDKLHLGLLQKNFALQVKNLLKDEMKRIDRFDVASQLLDPARVLKRGYTITFRDGVLIKSAKLLHTGDIIETEWTDGKVSSKIENKK